MSATSQGPVGPSNPQNNLDAMVGVRRAVKSKCITLCKVRVWVSSYQSHTFSKEKISILGFNWYWMLSMVFIWKQPQISDAVEFKYAQTQNVKIISYLNLNTTELCWLKPSCY